MSRVFFVALAVALLAAVQGAENGMWTRDPGSPVLTESRDLTRFDSGYVCEPRIVYDSDTHKYFMFYTGCTDADRA